MNEGAKRPFDERAARWIALRRDLHRHPELSGHEARTAAVVAELLSNLPVQLRTGVAGHGVVAELEGAFDGPTLVYRADLDALPIAETNDVPYRSHESGVMHACGHDVHTSVAVGLAEELSRRRDELCGRLRFVFQPSEEAAAPPGEVIGAEAMAQDGVLDDVDAAFAIHCLPELAVEHFGVCEAGVWAASDVFKVAIRGRTAHAAYPHQGIDAVQVAAAMVQALLVLPSRHVDPLQPCLITVGTVQAGTAHNILAGEAELTGILRTFDDVVRATTLDAMERLVTATAASFGAEASLEVRVGADAVINDATLTDVLQTSLRNVGATGEVVVQAPQMGAEDFSAFSRRIPSCYLFLGVADPAVGPGPALHTSVFDVDERCIPFAVSRLSQALLALAQSWDQLGLSRPGTT